MLTLMTVATSSQRYMPQFLESCKRVGLEPVVLGWRRRWRGLGMKLYLLRDALASLCAENPVVLFVDAHDTVIVHPASVILDRFNKMGRPLVFSAEKSCSPDPWKRLIYPRRRGPWRFLNSGGFIGEAELVHAFLRELKGKDLDRLNDQRWWTDRFIAMSRLISLDSRCEIFQTLWETKDELQFRHGIFNVRTGTRPSVFHGNGWTDMSLILEWWRRLGTAAASAEHGGRRRAPGDRHPVASQRSAPAGSRSARTPR